jgi:short-subunit dehydrogenase
MKKAFVTGATSGIGFEFARQLAEDGWEVTAVARSESKLREIVGKLRAGAPHNYVVADLATEKGIAQAAKALGNEKFDLLVNNAGVGAYGRFQDADLDKLHGMMRLNMDALMNLSHTYLQSAVKGDAIINVASTLGYMAFPGATTYSATKAFVINFTEGLWHEEKERGVYCMALCPGITKTGFHEAAGGQPADRPPDGISQDPADVVKEALHALKARKHVSVTTGTANNVMLFGARFMSRNALVNLMGRFGPHDEHATDHHGAGDVKPT